MRLSFLPRLINDPFSDPGLYIPFLFEKRAIMFDLGDLSALYPKDLLKLTHVFVTHTHMDHFIGFDTLLRILLGRDKDLHLYGPIGFLKQVEGKLSGYTWNLVSNYHNAFNVIANEVHPDKIVTKTFSCSRRFAPGKRTERAFNGLLLREPSFSVEGVLLDHHTPCIGLSLKENFYVNIKKNALDELGLPVGPWLKRFKDAIYRGADPRDEMVVTWEKGGRVLREERFPMGFLMERIAGISEGQKITYITDVVYSRSNVEKIVYIARGSDALYIEAAFLDSEREKAKKKYHLTARQAGMIARMAGVRHLEIFHFSPRYQGRASALYREAHKAFKGKDEEV